MNYSNRISIERLSIAGLLSYGLDILNTYRSGYYQLIEADTWYADNALHIDNPSYPECRLALYACNQSDVQIHISFDDLEEDADLRIRFAAFNEDKKECMYLIDHKGTEAAKRFCDAYGFELNETVLTVY